MADLVRDILGDITLAVRRIDEDIRLARAARSMEDPYDSVGLGRRARGNFSHHRNVLNRSVDRLISLAESEIPSFDH